MPAFQAGIDRVIRGIKKGLCIALMCAERDPFDCHRFVLVSRELAGRGVRVEHILSPDRAVSQEELEQRLLKKYGLNHYQPGLFELPKQKNSCLRRPTGCAAATLPTTLKREVNCLKKKTGTSVTQLINYKIILVYWLYGV